MANTSNFAGSTEITYKDGQYTFSDEILQRLMYFQSDAVKYLQNVEPQSNNLFFVSGFEEDNKHTKKFYNAQFRVRDIQLPSLKLSFNKHPVTEVPLLDKGDFDGVVSINFFEDVYHSVYKYHDDWMARWYNRRYDVLRCGASGKFRKMHIVAYHMVNDSSTIIPTAKIEPIFAVFLGGLAPQSVTPLSFSYEEDGNDKFVQGTYTASRVDMIYSSKLGLGKTANLWGDNDNTILTELEKSAVFNPKGLASTANEFAEGEKLRIARAISTHYI